MLGLTKELPFPEHGGARGQEKHQNTPYLGT